MLKVKYKIEETFKTDGTTKKDIPQDWKNGEYEIYLLKTGTSAILPNEKEGTYLRTSTVQSFEIYQNVVRITTNNTIYFLKPFVVEAVE